MPKIIHVASLMLAVTVGACIPALINSPAEATGPNLPGYTIVSRSGYVNVRCPAGTVVLGGGARNNDPGQPYNSHYALSESRPFHDSSGYGWMANGVAVDGSGPGGGLAVWAVCARP